MRSNFIENIVYETIGLKKRERLTLKFEIEINNFGSLWKKKFIMKFFEWIFMAFFDSFLEIWWIIMDKEWYLDKNILIRKKMKCEKNLMSDYFYLWYTWL